MILHLRKIPEEEKTSKLILHSESPSEYFFCNLKSFSLRLSIVRSLRTRSLETCFQLILKTWIYILEMEAEAWKALKQAAIRFELKTGTGQLKTSGSTWLSTVDFRFILVWNSDSEYWKILTIEKDWMFMSAHVAANVQFMSLLHLGKQTRMYTLKKLVHL